MLLRVSIEHATDYCKHLLTAKGVTVGFVVIPQGMAYALLAKLPPEYGLYTSFVGFLLYWAFATSKDITIGVSYPE
jgi:sodium-independent sulfate anion transporter 11